MQQVLEETGLIRATTVASMVGAWRQAEQQINWVVGHFKVAHYRQYRLRIAAVRGSVAP